MSMNARIAATGPGTDSAPPRTAANSDRPWSMVTTYAPQVRTAPATNNSHSCLTLVLSLQSPAEPIKGRGGAAGGAGRRPRGTINGPGQKNPAAELAKPARGGVFRGDCPV